MADPGRGQRLVRRRGHRHGGGRLALHRGRRHRGDRGRHRARAGRGGLHRGAGRGGAAGPCRDGVQPHVGHAGPGQPRARGGDRVGTGRGHRDLPPASLPDRAHGDAGHRGQLGPVPQGAHHLALDAGAPRLPQLLLARPRPRRLAGEGDHARRRRLFRPQDEPAQRGSLRGAGQLQAGPPGQVDPGSPREPHGRRAPPRGCGHCHGGHRRERDNPGREGAPRGEHGGVPGGHVDRRHPGHDDLPGSVSGAGVRRQCRGHPHQPDGARVVPGPLDVRVRRRASR